MWFLCVLPTSEVVVRVLQHSCRLVDWATRTITGLIVVFQATRKLPLSSLSRSTVDGGMDGWLGERLRSSGNDRATPALPCPFLPALLDHFSGWSGQTRQVVTGPGKVACFPTKRMRRRGSYFEIVRLPFREAPRSGGGGVMTLYFDDWGFC
jgi:hypothetical protein